MKQMTIHVLYIRKSIRNQRKFDFRSTKCLGIMPLFLTLDRGRLFVSVYLSIHSDGEAVRKGEAS